MITGDPIGFQMAGPAIRAWNIAKELTDNGLKVRLISTSTVAEGFSSVFDVEQISLNDKKRVSDLLDIYQIVVFQGYALSHFPVIIRKAKFIVADLYDPMHLEQLEQQNGHSVEAWASGIRDTTGIINQQLLTCDFFMAASEKQRLFWLGQLAGMGRLTPQNYVLDSDMRKLIDVVPFGLPTSDPVQKNRGIRNQFPHITDDYKIIVWGGGVYNWFDPLTLINAVNNLNERGYKIALVFLGVSHPNSDVPEMEMLSMARELVRSLKGSEKFILFNEGWVPYAERADYLLDADAGVSTHFQHIETTFSFRTRILDYLWAGLPILSTEGDGFAELIEQKTLGVVVREQSVIDIEEGLLSILYDSEYQKLTKSNVMHVREHFQWKETLKPLVNFCKNPHRSNSFIDSQSTGTRNFSMRESVPIPSVGIWAYKTPRDIRLAWMYFRAGGFESIFIKLKSRRRFQKAEKLRRDSR